MKTMMAEALYIGLESLEFRFINTETYPGWLELSLTGTNFHGPKPVRATELLLYNAVDNLEINWAKADKSKLNISL